MILLLFLKFFIQVVFNSEENHQQTPGNSLMAFPLATIKDFLGVWKQSFETLHSHLWEDWNSETKSRD